MTWRRMQQQQHAFGLVEIPTAIAIGAALASAAAGSAAAIIQSRHAAQTIDYNTGVAEQQAEIARRAGEYNAELATRQAELAQRAGDTAEADSRQETARLRAAQRAVLGDSGALSSEGSPLLVLLDAAAQSEVEAQRARYGGALGVYSGATDAALARYTGQLGQQSALASSSLLKRQGAQALQGGYIGAGTSLLTGAANVGTAYLYGQPKKKPTSYDPGNANLAY